MDSICVDLGKALLRLAETRSVPDLSYLCCRHILRLLLAQLLNPRILPLELSQITLRSTQAVYQINQNQAQVYTIATLLVAAVHV